MHTGREGTLVTLESGFRVALDLDADLLTFEVPEDVLETYCDISSYNDPETALAWLLGIKGYETAENSG